MKSLFSTTLKALLCIMAAVPFISSCVEHGEEMPAGLSTFLERTAPGFYGNGTLEFTYTDYTSQYAIYTYNNGESVDYRLLTTNPAYYMIASNVPFNLVQGSTYEITVMQNYTTELSQSFTAEFTVEQNDGQMAWLYNAENQYGIVLSLE